MLSMDFCPVSFINAKFVKHTHTHTHREKKSTESTHARGLRTLSQVKAWGGHDPKKEHRGETNTGGERIDERERRENRNTILRSEWRSRGVTGLLNTRRKRVRGG